MARSLETYRDKRDFDATSEPAGASPGRRRQARAKQPRFVVQEHSATAMHWDLRLEHDGVLLSWAVPKGIPLEPDVNRLAVRTEDHPLEYLDFEGTIPEGSYGAGTMSVWDHGTYELEELSIEAGKVHIELHGEQAQGRYLLVRTREQRGKEQWLLRRLDPADDAERVPLPEHVKPMLAKLAELPEDESGWAFEVKWDGIRAVVFAEGGRVRIETRTQNDITKQYPDLAPLGRALGSHTAVLDGEIVAFDEAGKPSFQTLQGRLGITADATIRTRAKAIPVRYLAFDLLHLDGHDTTELPYEERRRLLRELLADDERWQVPEHHVGEGSELLEAVVAQGLEGVMAKPLGSTYQAGNRGTWRKIKQQQRQEFVIGGWTEGAGRRTGSLGALCLGYHDEHGQLRYAGNVGTGFKQADLEHLQTLLTKLARKTSPFEVNSPGSSTTPGKWQAIRANGKAASAVIHYATPKLVCEVEFTEFTRDGTLRHPSFKGLRDDKDAADVVREDQA